MEGKLLKIRLKMITLFLIIILIPLIFLYAYLSNAAMKRVSDAQVQALKNINETKADYIADVIHNLSFNEKEFASSDYLKKYIERAKLTQDAEYYKQVSDAIRNTVKRNHLICDMFVTSNSGTVLAAYDAETIGTYCERYKELDSAADSNSGVSHIYGPTDSDSCSFYVVKRVYSGVSNQIGLVVERVDLTQICKSLSLTGYSNYASVLLVDSAGKYISSSVSYPKSLTAVAEYREIGDNIADAIPYYTTSSITQTLSAEYDGKTVIGTSIPEAGWSVVSYYDNVLASGNISADFKSAKFAVVIFCITTSALAILICITYTEPLNKMIRVINQKNKGDTTIRLELNTNDEFGEIGSAFNTMFDSIYESEQRYRTVVSMMDNVVFEINLKACTVYVSNNFNQKFSFRAQTDSISNSFLYKMKIHKDDIKRFNDDVEKILIYEGEKWEGEYRLKNIYGDFSWFRIQGRKFKDQSGTPSKIIGMIADIDREKKSTINLMQKANYDALTQLFNRASFLRSLDEEMRQSESRRSLDALMFIDLDDFKHFNDEYGHKCGDEVLKFVAESIKELTSDRGFGGRLGGDEFVMCLTNLKLIGDAGKVADDMIKTLNAGFKSETTGLHLNIHCSIGIAFFRENGSNPTELLESADTAMYKIKKSGKSNYAFADGVASSEET